MLSLKRLAHALGLLSGLLASAGLLAQTPPTPDKAEPPAEAASGNSGMDAQLFYQLLIGEIELRGGNVGTAYQVLLDGARRSGDEALFRRVINIALQARAGDEAVQAARAWALSLPQSIEAHQTSLQLVALLNRPEDAVEPLRALLRLGTVEQRSAVILSLPRLFQRSPEPKRVLASLGPVLQGQMGATRQAATFVEARLAIHAGDNARALSLTRSLDAALPEGDEPMQLALELLPTHPEAEPMVRARLARTPEPPQLRLAYARTLARAQRPADAVREFRILSEAQPENGAVWLALGALEVELHQALSAELSLREAVKRLDEPAAGASAEEVRHRAAMRQQAWLLLAQLAEQRGDLAAAAQWLNRIEGATLEVQYRRASLLARQGKLEAGRQLLRALPQSTDEEARARWLAESQLLRENKSWTESLAVLQQATQRLPHDPDLLYEQAMVAEKLGRFEDMEAWLRHVIQLKPDHHHAYNALGYSLADRNVRLDEAKALIEQALKLSPGEPFLIDSLGWVEFRLGRIDEAVRLLRQAYEARPDTEIASHLGEALWVAGQRDDARRVWREASARDPKSEVLRDTLERLKVGP